MDVLFTFVKNYFVLLLIVYVLSYLTPKEEYRKYFQFLVAVLVVAVLSQPLLVYFGGVTKEEAKQQLQEILTQMERMDYQEKGESIFEQYLGKLDEETQ